MSNSAENDLRRRRVSVRAAGTADAAGIAAVHVASWEGAYRGMVPDEEIDRRTVAWRTARWERILGADSPAWVAVAERDGTVVGFISLGATDEPATVLITALYVAPPAWRTGAGAALMDAALAQAAGDGYAQITLWVLEPNHRARAFYERCGFAEDGGRQNEGDGSPDELRMRRAV